MSNGSFRVATAFCSLLRWRRATEYQGISLHFLTRASWNEFLGDSRGGCIHTECNTAAFAHVHVCVCAPSNSPIHNTCGYTRSLIPRSSDTRAAVARTLVIMPGRNRCAILTCELISYLGESHKVTFQRISRI